MCGSFRQLAAKMGRAHGYISKTELGERRLDMLEFIEFCDGCGQDPAEFIRDFRRTAD
jgi:transcriptional regulator with XRE-family HTH domain